MRSLMGLAASALAGLFGGVVLVLISAFAPQSWFERLPRIARQAR